ncbi:MAG TPA: OmpH family outer membrane protein [Candidatus Baltobacteraceae bacterium]|nr:OmpH family outer membrane protein [Candidatus Baltobacteraceae bacterium]
MCSKKTPASSPRSSHANAHIIATLVVLGLVACTHAPPAQESATGPSDSGRIGVVRMSALIAEHPLYPQLARLDEDIDALRLTGMEAGSTGNDSPIPARISDMRTQLDTAARSTQERLESERKSITDDERRAVDRALASAGISGASALTIERQIAQVSADQAHASASDAIGALAAYRDALAVQERTEFIAFAKTLDERQAERSEAERMHFQEREENFAAEQARSDAPERVELQAKLANLALDDQARLQLSTQLESLDRSESDDLAAMRNRDSKAIADLVFSLQVQRRDQLTQEAARLRARSAAKLAEREQSVRSDVVGQLTLVAPPTHSEIGDSALPPDLRTRLETMHDAFQSEYALQAQRTLEEFRRTQADLRRRFEALRAADVAARESARVQVERMGKERDDLKTQIEAQINRDVARVARERGIDVVFRDIVAPANAVDLTAQVKKDIESIR